MIDESTEKSFLRKLSFFYPQNKVCKVWSASRRSKRLITLSTKQFINLFWWPSHHLNPPSPDDPPQGSISGMVLKQYFKIKRVTLGWPPDTMSASATSLCAWAETPVQNESIAQTVKKRTGGKNEMKWNNAGRIHLRHGSFVTAEREQSPWPWFAPSLLKTHFFFPVISIRLCKIRSLIACVVLIGPGMPVGQELWDWAEGEREGRVSREPSLSRRQTPAWFRRHTGGPAEG